MFFGVLLVACQSAPVSKQEPISSEPEKLVEPLTEKEKLLQSPNQYLRGEVSESARLLFNKAMDYKNDNQLEQASQTLSNLVMQFPKLSGAHLQLAYIAKEQGQSSVYAAHLEDALAANANNYFAANELVLVEREAGNFDKALALYQQAIKSWPGFATSYINQGILYDLYLNEKQKAVESLQTYLVLADEQSESTKKVKVWLIDLDRQIKAQQKEASSD